MIASGNENAATVGAVAAEVVEVTVTMTDGRHVETHDLRPDAAVHHTETSIEEPLQGAKLIRMFQAGEIADWTDDPVGRLHRHEGQLHVPGHAR